MQKNKECRDVRLDARAIKNIRREFDGQAHDLKQRSGSSILSVKVNGETWRHDDEAEFFSDISRGAESYTYSVTLEYGYELSILAVGSDLVSATVRLPTRSQVEAVFQVLEGNVTRCSILKEDGNPVGSGEEGSHLNAAMNPLTKKKHFPGVRFDPDAIAAASSLFQEKIKGTASCAQSRKSLSIEIGDEEWEHVDEEEFFADIHRGADAYNYRVSAGECGLSIQFGFSNYVRVSLPKRPQIEAVFQVLERHVQRCQLPVLEGNPEAIAVTVFIGHGQCAQWRDLKDHLHDKHGYRVEAYEIGARAGHSIRDILEEMLDSSSIAFLVMTAEDAMTDGSLHARQNVVHEIGLFQGRLGFARGIVLLEEGAEEFSNLHGIQQIRFRKGGIREAFGDVLATIRREFGDHRG